MCETINKINEEFERVYERLSYAERAELSADVFKLKAQRYLERSFIKARASSDRSSGVACSNS